MTTLKTQAIELAKKGFRVLPLRRASRIPSHNNWQKMATTDGQSINTWWDRTPNANVGIATGFTFIVLDIDVKKGKHGAQSLRELQKAYKLPKTYTVRTPSGGLHLYYKHPYPAPHISELQSGGTNNHRAIKNLVDWSPIDYTADRVRGLSNPKSGIDIRAEGGQVVAPGMQVSDFPGKYYEILFDVKMTELPKTLIELLPYKQEVPRETDQQTSMPTNADRAPGSGPTTNKTQGAATQNTEQLDRYRDVPDYARSTDADSFGPDASGLVTGDDPSAYSNIPDAIPAGSRDDTLFRFMCSWRERGYPLAHAEILARELHTRLEQPARDEITLDTVLAKLQRTYATYVPSAIDAAAMQAIKPTESIEQLAAQGAASDDPLANAEVVLEPQKAIESVLESLNRFVFCIEGNSVIDTTKHPAYANIKIDAFKSAYGNIRLKTSSRANAKTLQLPKLWLEHVNRQTVDDYGYKPNGAKVYEHLGTRFYNKWAPSELFEEMRDVHPSSSDDRAGSNSHNTGADSSSASVFSESNLTREPNDGRRDSRSNSISINITSSVASNALEVFFDHLDYLFDDDEREKQAFWTWLAYSVRYPERRVAHGVLIVSEPGVGKSWFYKLLQKLVGVYEVNTASNAELDSTFNEWVFGCSMVVVHELMTGNKKHMMQQLLSLVTEERILINGKHKAARMRDIYANFLAFSNHGANAAAIMAKDRRWFVYQSAASKASAAYYRNLFGWLDTDGPLELLRYIHAMDLSKFNPGEAPITTVAKQRMEYTNMGLVEQAITDAIDDEAGPFVADIVGSEVVEKYLESIMELTAKDRTHARVAIASVCPPLKQTRYRWPKERKQHRLRAIRNGKFWAKAGAEAVLAEYTKALSAVSLPVAQLEVV